MRTYLSITASDREQLELRQEPDGVELSIRGGEYEGTVRVYLPQQQFERLVEEGRSLIMDRDLEILEGQIREEVAVA